MAQFTVCDTCGTILAGNLGNVHAKYYSIKAIKAGPTKSFGPFETYDEGYYAVCDDCYKKLKECAANLTEINFKGKVPVVHIQLGKMTNEKGNHEN